MDMQKYTQVQQAWRSLAEHIAAGNCQEALGIYRLLARSFEQEVTVMHLYADILHALGMPEQARDVYARIVHKEL